MTCRHGQGQIKGHILGTSVGEGERQGQGQGQGQGQVQAHLSELYWDFSDQILNQILDQSFGPHV